MPLCPFAIRIINRIIRSFYHVIFTILMLLFMRFSDAKGKYTNCREVLAELGLRNVSDQDCENVRYVCSVVSRRAAHLASAGIATLLNKMAEDNVTVGIDGSVYRFHPYFHDLMTQKINQLQNHKVRSMGELYKESARRIGSNKEINKCASHPQGALKSCEKNFVQVT